MKTLKLLPLLGIALVGLVDPISLSAQGMPPEARKNIHQLFNQHAKVTRSVTLTPQGYVAVTESTDPQVAAALREHVGQMEARMKSGRMVRRHDPAFAEFGRHYDDMTLVVEPTRTGLKVTVTGKTPEAIRVAQNHATVVTDFAAHGWEAHDRDHAAVLTGKIKPEAEEVIPAVKEPAAAVKAAAACCENGAGCCKDGPARQKEAVVKPVGGLNHHGAGFRSRRR